MFNRFKFYTWLGVKYFLWFYRLYKMLKWCIYFLLGHPHLFLAILNSYFSVILHCLFNRDFLSFCFTTEEKYWLVGGLIVLGGLMYKTYTALLNLSEEELTKFFVTHYDVDMERYQEIILIAFPSAKQRKYMPLLIKRPQDIPNDRMTIDDLITDVCTSKPHFLDVTSEIKSTIWIAYPPDEIKKFLELDHLIKNAEAHIWNSLGVYSPLLLDSEDGEAEEFKDFFYWLVAYKKRDLKYKGDGIERYKDFCKEVYAAPNETWIDAYNYELAELRAFILKNYF